MTPTQRLMHGLPYLVFFSALFFVEMAVFGISDAILCIVFLFFARQMVASPGLGLRAYVTQSCWFVAMAVCAIVAGFHPAATIVIGALFFFVIVLFTSDDYLPRNYFWLGLGFLLLLVNPVTVPTAIALRLVALLVALVATGIFVFAARSFLAKDAFDIDREYVCEAFAELSHQLEALSKGDTDEVDAQILFEIAEDYAQDEYPTVFSQGSTLSGRETYTFALLLSIEQVAKTADAAAQGTPGEEEREYFARLASLFARFGRWRAANVHAAAGEVEAFLKDNALPFASHDAAWRRVLGALAEILRDTDDSRSYHAVVDVKRTSRLSRVRQTFSTRNVRVRFAVKLALAMAVALGLGVALTNVAGMLFGAWAPVVAFILLYTFDDEEKAPTFGRLIGLAAGLGVFVVLALLVPSEFHLVIAVILGFAVALMDLGTGVTVAALSQLVLGALYPSFSFGDPLSTGLLVVVGVAALAAMLGYLLLRFLRRDVTHARLLEIEDMDAELVESIYANVEEGDADIWYSVQPLYFLHLNACLLEEMSLRMELLEQRLGEHTEDHDWMLAGEIERVLQLNYAQIMQTAYEE